MKAIQDQRLQRGDSLPSINALSADHQLARETVVKAYNQLKEKGVVASRRARVFSSRPITTPSRPMFLCFLMSCSRPIKSGSTAASARNYGIGPTSTFTITTTIPKFSANSCKMPSASMNITWSCLFPTMRVRAALAGFDQSKLLLLDIDIDYPGKACAVIRQSHNAELERALDCAADRLAAYEGVTLVFPRG